MQQNNVYEWISREENRRKIILSIQQPLTAKQVSRKTGIGKDTCSYLLSKFASKGIVSCLNPTARSSRLYWVTELGKEYQRELSPDYPDLDEDFLKIDWELYGWVCFSHRATIIQILTEPMQPAGMKKKLRLIGSKIPISANNIRDVIRLFLQKRIVQKVFVRKKIHPQYELSEIGTKFRRLLASADRPMQIR